MDIEAWLRELGLERYEEAFRENEIDAEILPKLTADDLKDIGVTTVGHRRRLLEAISALTDPVLAPQAEPSAPAEAAPRARPAEAERRQLTVLFCDLVGSTELSARLDPEDLRTVMSAYHRCAAAVVEGFEGYVAKYLGDGMLAYFGWPQAHEDDAERAVRAGLKLVERIAQLELHADVRLRARVGVSTGQVVVGDLVGEGAPRDEAVVGDTPNLAARLQALAQPDTVVISQGTRRLVGSLFELDDLGPQSLRGFAEPLSAWRIKGEGHAEGRFEALHGERLTPLVGRESELVILLERWAWAKDGDGQVVLLSGEPGIGKSRVVRALRERLGNEPYTPLSHYCSPYHTNSALHPVIALLERATRLNRDEPPDEQLASLEAVLGPSSDRLDEVVPLLAALLGVPTGQHYPALTLTPEAQKLRTLHALVDQLAALAAQRPVLALYEDVHWIDPSTLELLGLVIERIQRLPVLMLITHRPEFQPPWTGQAHVTPLTVSRLGRRQGADLAARVLGDKSLPAEVIEQIVAKTDGVPLFVEELTKAVLEAGLLRDAGDRYELSGPLPPLAIPATLHDSLMARLDRLAPVKEVAQIGAVIGREFSFELLAAISPLTEDRLGEALEQLVRSELVFRRGVPPHATYSFKHALVQDTAYQSLLKSRRQQLHARIAEALEQELPDVGDLQPEALARHFTNAGLAARAIPYWRRAGELAAGRSANMEAIAHLSKGLELVPTLPNVAQHLDQELNLRLAIGGPLMATTGNSSSEVEQNYSRALELCDQLNRSAELFPVLRGLWNCYSLRGEFQRAFELAKRSAVLADEEGTPLRRAHACRTLGNVLFFLGHVVDAAQEFERGIALDATVEDMSEHRAHALLHGEHPGVFCRIYLALALWLLGAPDRASEMINTALALGHSLAQPYSIAVAQGFAAILHCWRREFPAALGQAEAVIAAACQHHLQQVFGFGTLGRGFALVGLGQQVEGIAQLRTGLTAWNGIGAHLQDTQWLTFLAEAHLQAGQFGDALTALDRATEIAAATGERHYQAELFRLRGLVLAKTGEEAEAPTWLQRAIDTARSQHAKSLELRAATSLARLWAEHDERRKAHDLLAPVYGWFTEGFDTADLKDAKTLLDELA